MYSSMIVRNEGFQIEIISNKTLYRSGLTFAQAKTQLATEASAAPELKLLADFLIGSTRGIVR